MRSWIGLSLFNSQSLSPLSWYQSITYYPKESHSVQYQLYHTTLIKISSLLYRLDYHYHPTISYDQASGWSPGQHLKITLCRQSWSPQTNSSPHLFSTCHMGTSYLMITAPTENLIGTWLVRSPSNSYLATHQVSLYDSGIELKLMTLSMYSLSGRRNYKIVGT